MADLRLWSKELIAELIDMYKSFPCLWKVKSEDYTNKYFKAEAYNQLVKFCKTRGFPEATRDFVVRKIQSLRGSFRKELRRAVEYQNAGKSFTPTLWYYNNLLFTKDIENSVDDDSTRCHSDDNDDDDERSNSDGDCTNEDTKFVDETITIRSPSPPPPKRKRKTTDCLPTEFVEFNTPKTKELSEFDVTGMNIANKLAKMDTTQAIYAETIINKVIFKGLLKKLREETDICENSCYSRAASHSSLRVKEGCAHGFGKGGFANANVTSLPSSTKN